MNPDQNQPDNQPSDTSSTPTPVAPVTDVPAPEVPTPSVEPSTESSGAPAETPAPNPFGGAPASDTAAPNPFGAAPVTAPTVEGAVIGSAPAGDPLATPPVKSNKKLVILISAIVGGLIILGGAALAIYFLFFSVTKADYQAAFDQVTIVRDKYSSSSSVSSNTTEEKIKATETSFTDFKTENAKLGNLKAFKADKDLKVKYEAYNTKAKAFITFGDALLPSLNGFVSASAEIKSLGTGATSFTAANIQKTIDILKGIDATDPTLKAYLSSAIVAYEEILPQVKIYESKTSTSAQKYAAISAISDSSDKVLDAAKKMTKDLKAAEEAVDLKDPLNDLGKAVTAKLNAK